MATNGSITVSADIKNIGNYETEEIVQFYVRDKVGSITRPIKELKGFEKINLKPGDVKTVSFELKAEDLQFFNGDDFVIEPGDFDVWIGPNSDEGLHSTFVLK
jgi:beta-glucosidase